VSDATRQTRLIPLALALRRVLHPLGCRRRHDTNCHTRAGPRLPRGWVAAPCLEIARTLMNLAARAPGGQVRSDCDTCPTHSCQQCCSALPRHSPLTVHGSVLHAALAVT
jgi:hypothetical protein